MILHIVEMDKGSTALSYPTVSQDVCSLCDCCVLLKKGGPTPKSQAIKGLVIAIVDNDH